MRDELEADRQRRIEETTKQIEAETRRALEQIRVEVAELTLEATTKVTGKVLTDEDHRRLIEDAIGELDFSVLEGETRRNSPNMLVREADLLQGLTFQCFLTPPSPPTAY